MPRGLHARSALTILFVCCLMAAPARIAAQCASCLGAVSLPPSAFASPTLNSNLAQDARSSAQGFFSAVNLSSIPAGQWAIGERAYPGWCGDFPSAPAIAINSKPISTYGSALSAADQITYGKINYILNHK